MHAWIHCRIGQNVKEINRMRPSPPKLGARALYEEGRNLVP